MLGGGLNPPPPPGPYQHHNNPGQIGLRLDLPENSLFSWENKLLQFNQGIYECLNISTVDLTSEKCNYSKQ